MYLKRMSNSNPNEQLFEALWAVLSSDGCIHRIYAKHNQVTGKRIIEHNGSRVVEERRVVDTGSKHELILRRMPGCKGSSGRTSVDSEIATVIIASCHMGTAYRYDLQVESMPYSVWNESVHQRARILAFDVSRAWGTYFSHRAFLSYAPACQAIFTVGDMQSVDHNALSEQNRTYVVTRELRNAQPTFPMDDRVGTVTCFSLSPKDLFATRSGDVNASKISEEHMENIVVDFELHADPNKDEYLLTAVRPENSNIDDKGSTANAAKTSFLSIRTFSALVDFIPELTQPFVIEFGVPKSMSSSSKGEGNIKLKRRSSWFRRSKRK